MVTILIDFEWCSKSELFFIRMHHHLLLYSGDPKTAHVRFSNGRPQFDFRMVRFSNGSVFEWSKNKMAASSLAQTILYIKTCFIFVNKTVQANGLVAMFFRPFENRMLKCPVFECFRFSNVRYSDPHCSSVFQCSGPQHSCSHPKSRRLSTIQNINVFGIQGPTVQHVCWYLNGPNTFGRGMVWILHTFSIKNNCDQYSGNFYCLLEAIYKLRIPNLTFFDPQHECL